MILAIFKKYFVSHPPYKDKELRTKPHITCAGKCSLVTFQSATDAICDGLSLIPVPPKALKPREAVSPSYLEVFLSPTEAAGVYQRILWGSE